MHRRAPFPHSESAFCGSGFSRDLLWLDSARSRLVALARPCAPRHKDILSKKPLPHGWLQKALACSAWLLAILATSGTASAADFRLGEVEGLLDFALSYGVSVRTEDRDQNLIAVGNGGNGFNANIDDGTLNYDTGVVSNMLRGSARLSMRWGPVGLFARGAAFYDYEQEEGVRPHRPLSDAALDKAGSDILLQDLYLSARFSWAGTPVQIRAGDQVINWGETTLLRDGVDIINPFDLVALFQPASLPRDFRIPQGTVWAAANLTEALAVEGYYQYDWQSVALPPTGTYFSTNDLFGADGPNFAMLGPGRFSDLGTDLDQAFGLPAGTLGFDRDFFKLPGRFEETPDDGGEFGLALVGIFQSLNSTKLGLHFVQYHSRLPLFGGLTATQEAVDATSQEAVDARAAQLSPVYEDTGLDPDEAAARALETAGQLTISGYANQAGYLAEYPEDIHMLGLSFNTATLRSGTLIAGEISRHFDFPFQVALRDVFDAALSPIQFTDQFRNSALGEFGPSERIQGFVELDRTQGSVEVTQLLGPRLGAAQTTVGLDVAWMHVHEFPDPAELPLQATAPPDADSWGYRLVGLLQYPSVFGGINLFPRIVFAHDLSGTTPGPLASFVEDRKALSVGVQMQYINRWFADLSYTDFFGGGTANLLGDRDFLRLRVTYAF